jgi:hypothetical protein
MNAPKRWTALTLCSLLAACANTDNYSFIRYGQTPDPRTHRFDATAVPPLSDVLALNYASSVATILRCKFNGARVAREVSSTAQVALAAFAGAGAAFNYGASTVTALSLGSAGIPELQKIFDAKGRAQIYQDAVRLIEEAEIEYLSLNQAPSDKVLTQNGVTLFQRVTASIHVVEKTLAGHLPTVDDMQKATERMSQAGATKTPPGSAPVNNLPANPRVEAAVARSVRNPETISRLEFDKLKAELERMKAGQTQNFDFVATIRSVNRDPTLTPAQRKEIYVEVVKDAGLAGTVEPDPNAMIGFFEDLASAGQRTALSSALKKRVKP